MQAVAISPDGTRGLAGAKDGTARLWEVESGRAIGPLLRHGGQRVGRRHFSPDGALAVTACQGTGRARLWKVGERRRRGPHLRTAGRIEFVEFHSAGDGAGITAGSHRRCGPASGTLRWPVRPS